MPLLKTVTPLAHRRKGRDERDTDDTCSKSSKSKPGFPWSLSKVSEFDWRDERFTTVAKWVDVSWVVKRTELDKAKRVIDELKKQAVSLFENNQFEKAQSVQDEADVKRKEWKRPKLIYDEGISVAPIAKAAMEYQKDKSSMRLQVIGMLSLRHVR